MCVRRGWDALAYVADKPRRDRGAALLHYFNIPDPEGHLLDEMGFFEWVSG